MIIQKSVQNQQWQMLFSGTDVRVIETNSGLTMIINSINQVTGKPEAMRLLFRRPEAELLCKSLKERYNAY